VYEPTNPGNGPDIGPETDELLDGDDDEHDPVTEPVADVNVLTLGYGEPSEGYRGLTEADESYRYDATEYVDDHDYNDDFWDQQ
jgi:hypothetical protein